MHYVNSSVRSNVIRPNNNWNIESMYPKTLRWILMISTRNNIVSTRMIWLSHKRFRFYLRSNHTKQILKIYLWSFQNPVIAL